MFLSWIHFALNPFAIFFHVSNNKQHKQLGKIAEEKLAALLSLPTLCVNITSIWSNQKNKIRILKKIKMLHNEITSEREREIFKVNYAVVVVVAFYCQTHTQFVYWTKVWGWKETLLLCSIIVGDIHKEWMHAVVKKLFIYDIFIIIVIVYIVWWGVGEIEILTHLR